MANHPLLSVVESTPEARGLPFAGVTRVRQYCTPVRLPPDPPPEATSKPRPPTGRVSPVTRITFPACRAHYPGGSRRVHLSIASPLTRPSPLCRRVGIRTSTFEACSGFTHVTARRIARPPKATFVTRLRSSRSPDQTARQLPEQSTTLWVEPSSTGGPRHRGAPHRSGHEPTWNTARLRTEGRGHHAAELRNAGPRTRGRTSN